MHKAGKRIPGFDGDACRGATAAVGGEAMTETRIILFYVIVGEICVAYWLFKRIEVWDYIVENVTSVLEWIYKKVSHE
jgi:hypothetical protein